MALSVPDDVDTLVSTADTLPSTLTAASAARRVWDVLIIGAGPAGSLAARELARRGAATLLVDRAKFPRHKVCGSCLSAAGLMELDRAGLGHLPRRLQGRSLHRLRVCAAKRHADIDIPTGAAISRRALDAALVLEATRHGAEFLCQTSAQLDGIGEGTRGVYLRASDQLRRTQARIVLVADGLGGRSLQQERGFGRFRSSGSRMGASTLCQHAPSDYPEGTIHMACGRGGYVGLVRIETGELDVAAAFDRVFIQRSGSPGAAAASILAEAGLPAIASLAAQEWHGTGWLTSSPVRVAAERLFVLGDAAGYIEPFTGEGMTWAMASARAVTEVAMEAIDTWRPELADRWAELHRSRIQTHQSACRWLARGLRCHWLTRGVITALQRWPEAAAPLVWYVHRPLSRT